MAIKLLIEATVQPSHDPKTGEPWYKISLIDTKECTTVQSSSPHSLGIVAGIAVNWLLEGKVIS